MNKTGGFISLTKKEYSDFKKYYNSYTAYEEIQPLLSKYFANERNKRVEEYKQSIKEKKMTSTEEKIEIMQAYEDAKIVEYSTQLKTDTWYPLSNKVDPTWNWDTFNYRIKPEPTKIPLTAADMTPTTWIRNKASIKTYQITDFNKEFVLYMQNNTISVCSYEQLMDNWEISTNSLQFDFKPAYNLK